MTTRCFATRLTELRPTAVNRVLAEARTLQAQGRTLLPLMRGQPDTPTAGHIVAAGQEALAKGRTGYPDNQGEPALRQAVAERLHRDHGLTYDPANEILITDGATAGLFTALGALSQTRGDLLLPDPIFDAYSGPITSWGARPAFCPSRLVAGRFTFGRA